MKITPPKLITHTHTHTLHTLTHHTLHTLTHHTLHTLTRTHTHTKVKQDCGEEVWGEGGGRMEDQMIMMLQRQLEDMQRSLDCLQQSDHNLRLSLRLAEQRAMESETKLSYSNDR